MLRRFGMFKNWRVIGLFVVVSTVLAPCILGRRRTVIKRLVLLAFTLLTTAVTSMTASPPSPPAGNTYYVSNSGNDSNSGTSTSSPWKTIAKVQSFLGNLGSGDSVLFQRGGIWYEQLDISNLNGTASARITFSNYGAGNLPIIDGGGT
ncbi:MAG: hypothetical protein DMG16_20745 [Acidobacteria bacterium]|nr:MAG: hypothetical protein DMG16_20745 [Acidobacteriota bacterium]